MRKLWGGLALFLSASLGVGAGEILRLELDGTVNPATSAYVRRGLAEAQRRGAALVVLVLDTPGGLDTATKDIVEALLASEVPVAVWVGPAGARAASAGTFLLLAAHVAAMAPGTSTGAAHPVALGGTLPEEKDPAVQKVVSDAAARLRAIAEARGRNADWAERAVRQSATATAQEALELGVIDLVAESLPDLLRKLEGFRLRDGRVLAVAGLPVRELPMTFRDRFLAHLADPNLVYILLMLGLYALIYEFLTPGVGLGLVVGVPALLLALFGLQLFPVSFVGVGLILFGLALIVLDVFTPSYGLLTLGGLASLVLGSLSLFEAESPVVRLSWGTVAATLGTLTAIFFFILAKGLRAQRHKPRPLTTLVGLVGEARDDLNPEGWVFVHGELWWARAEEPPIARGEPVEVVAQEGRKLRVRRPSRSA
ncbi:MAG: nodulation protein NfeD [Candidatus Bipolaricaulota bacterium]|nr:nodulation protein NfeD [Candidatus Bipolaricaulota bacterium]MDW8152397.1 nodulation protein NfeD [Candidatus Bipolaricaulota bacterium]